VSLAELDGERQADVSEADNSDSGGIRQLGNGGQKSLSVAR
jgi:hypothetical protein